ncbi:hypothetical protein GOV12_02085 [Candidatus Pacearchaeota archaeon]|nr:hypothetical protein [Candidatus Pacearchaeota archaeon]
MRIIGFNLTKISGKREDKLEGNLEITQNIDIKDISEDPVPFSQDKALRINFKFAINYSKGLAEIEFNGFIIILPDKEDLSKIIKDWEDKKIPDETRIPLFNFIMAKCNVKALALEDELNLPTHFQMPKLDPNKEKQQ